MTTRNFVDDRHALYVGWVLGMAWRHGLPFQLVDDADGNHTDRIVWHLKRGLADTIDITLVVPPPPDDWSPKDWS